MKARIIQTVDGVTIASEVELSNIRVAMEVRGYKFRKLNRNPSQRAELQGVPQFEGCHGPMWDGDAIRYECYETYRRLSE